MPKLRIVTPRVSTTPKNTIEDVYATAPASTPRTPVLAARAHSSDCSQSEFERQILSLRTCVDEFLQSRGTIAQEILANQRYLMQLRWMGTPILPIETTLEGVQEPGNGNQHKIEVAMSDESGTSPQNKGVVHATLERQILSWQARVDKFLENKDRVAQTILANQRFMMRFCLTDMADLPIEPNVEGLQKLGDHEDFSVTGKIMEQSDEMHYVERVGVEHVSGEDALLSSRLSKPVSYYSQDESFAPAAFAGLWRFCQSDPTHGDRMGQCSSALQNAVFMRSVPLVRFASLENCVAIARLMLSTHELNAIDLLQISNVLTSLSSAVVIILMDWAVSAVVAGFGLAVAWMFSQLNWDENFDTLYVGLLVGSVFTAWNIAQYASFAIQTTGHLQVADHIRAVCNVGGCLVLCNLVGWSLCVACLSIGSGIDYQWRSIIVLVPSVSSGVLGKTFCKLKYMKRFELACTAGLAQSTRHDALSWKLRRNPSTNAHMCPFTKVSIGAVLRHALGPYTCFVYTLVFTLGNHYLYVQAKSIHRDLERTVVRYVIFVGSNLCFVFGFILLNRWIRNNHGVMEYSGKMCMAFYFIYGIVTELQIRLGLVQFDGAQRLICSMLHPLLVTVLRTFEYFTLRKVFVTLGKANARWTDLTSKGAGPLVDETCVDIAHQYKCASDKLNRCVLFIASSMITQNVAGILLSGMSCMFQDAGRLSVGSCPRGFWRQVAVDNAPVFAADCLVITNLVGQGVPLFYYFLMLDPFLIVAVLVVTYMGVCLVLFTVGLGV